MKSLLTKKRQMATPKSLNDYVVVSDEESYLGFQPQTDSSLTGGWTIPGIASPGIVSLRQPNFGSHYYLSDVEGHVINRFYDLVEELRLIVDSNKTIKPTGIAKTIAKKYIDKLYRAYWSINSIGPTSDGGILLHVSKRDYLYAFDIYDDGEVVMVDLKNNTTPIEISNEVFDKMIYSLSD